MYDDLVDRLMNLSHFEIRNAESVIHVSAEAVTELREIAQEAADAIERLDKQCDALVADNVKLTELMPRWIPVKERLPEEEGGYLVAVQMFDKAWVKSAFFYPSRVDSFGADTAFSEVCVTHWMPLPAPPKEENNGREV